jgi:hypothetical protein
MAWTYDKPKVQAQWKEFTDFLDHARNDEPAGAADLLGRPFRHPVAGQPDMTPRSQPAIQQNYYLLQINQLYEAGLIDQRAYNQMVNQIYA